MRVRRQGVTERLLSVVYVFPFRCQLCGHRFRAMRWGERYVRRLVDRREYERLTTRMSAEARIGPDIQRVTLTEISIDGGTVETTAHLVPGQPMPLEIRDPRGPVVTMEEAVVRTVLDQRVGFQVGRLSPEGRDALRRVVLELLIAPRRQPSLPLPTPKNPL